MHVAEAVVRVRPPWGWNPIRTGALVLSTALALGFPRAQAQSSLVSCQSWRRSQGLERIRLGNTLGAEHYLTRRHRLQQSHEDAPVALYSDGDLARVCRDR